MTQTTLWPEDPTAAHHHANPESAAAFETIAPHLSRLQGAVLQYTCGRAKGATVKEVIRDLELTHQTASARLTELSHAELIERIGERRARCAVWKITSEGLSRLKTWSDKSTANQAA